MTEGVVTSIQRFSLNDGPGIRTTVFFKGCNLRCGWCHNPETIHPKNELLIFSEKCIHCGHCREICPSPEKCSGCGKCAEVCWAGAREMAGCRVTVEDVMAQVIQDEDYYRDSGGGVTLSGGEVFCQAEFASALAGACREAGIPVAAETNLLFDFERMLPGLKKFDLIMFDIKLFDSGAHQRWTEVGNELIMENVKRLDGLGVPLIARTPLIPGATDSAENITAIANMLAELKHLQYYELLNFNPLGDSKYRALGRDNSFAGARPLPGETFRRLLELAGKVNLTVKAG